MVYLKWNCIANDDVYGCFQALLSRLPLIPNLLTSFMVKREANPNRLFLITWIDIFGGDFLEERVSVVDHKWHSICRLMNKSVYRGIMIGVMTGYGCLPIGLFLDKVLVKLFVKT